MKPTREGAINLAYWLYKVHPELYARILPLATRAQGKLGSLGDDVEAFDSGTSTTFDTTDTFDAFDPSGSFDAFDPGVLSSLTPDMAAISAPDLVDVSVDTSGFTMPTFQTEDGGSIFSALGTGLSSVGNWLTSAAGLSTVGNLATTVLKAYTPQQQTVQTQVSRVAAGSNPAPITYGYNTSGQVVPILQTGVNQGRALNASTLAGFMPSSLKPYATPISIGILALLGIGLMRRRR